MLLKSFYNILLSLNIIYPIYYYTSLLIYIKSKIQISVLKLVLIFGVFSNLRYFQLIALKAKARIKLIRKYASISDLLLLSFFHQHIS